MDMLWRDELQIASMGIEEVTEALKVCIEIKLLDPPPIIDSWNRHLFKRLSARKDILEINDPENLK